MALVKGVYYFKDDMLSERPFSLCSSFTVASPSSPTSAYCVDKQPQMLPRMVPSGFHMLFGLF